MNTHDRSNGNCAAGGTPSRVSVLRTLWMPIMLLGMVPDPEVSAQCAFKFTWFVNTTTNDVTFYFIDPYVVFSPDSAAFEFTFDDGTPSVVNEYIFVHHYVVPGDHVVCLSGTYASGGLCEFTMCDTLRVGMDAPCLDTLLMTNVPPIACPTNSCCHVCGCNGQEYENACEAQWSGVKRYASGRCPGNTNIWDYGLAITRCAGHVEARLNGCTSTCYEAIGWSFGDGTTTSDTTNALVAATHDYGSDGVYIICVDLIDPAGVIGPQSVCDTMAITNTGQCHAGLEYALVGDTLELLNVSTSATTIDQTFWSVQTDTSQEQVSLAGSPHFLLGSGWSTCTICLAISSMVCNCYSDTCITVENATGISLGEAVGQWLSVSPNPFAHSARLQSRRLLPEHVIRIYDMLGRVILQRAGVPGYEEVIDVPELPVGTYILELVSAIGSIGRTRIVISGR